MIQEIYDYLLIRSHYLSNKEDLLEECSNKEVYDYTVKNISKLMQEENYLLTSTSIRKNVSDMIQKYRFDFCKSREMCDEVNFVITRLNEYEHMEPGRKRYLVKEWLKKEFKDRNLPYICQIPDLLFSAMANEHCLFMTICGYRFNEETSAYEYDNSKEYTEQQIDIMNYLQLINLLINRYPAFFYDLEHAENVVINLGEIIKYEKSRLQVRYAKKTLKSFKKLMNDVLEIKEEINASQKVKKTNY